VHFGLFLRAVGDHPVRLQGALHSPGRVRLGATSACCIWNPSSSRSARCWFIYLLPVFFVVTKATRLAPPLGDLALRPAALEMLHVADRLGTVIERIPARALRVFLFRLSVRHFTCSAAVRSRPDRRPRCCAGRTGAVDAAQRRPWVVFGLQRMAGDLAGVGPRRRPAPSSSSARCWRQSALGSTGPAALLRRGTPSSFISGVSSCPNGGQRGRCC